MSKGGGNPLFNKNIPPPPPPVAEPVPSVAPGLERQEGNRVSEQNANTVLEDNGISVSGQSGKTVEQQNSKMVKGQNTNTVLEDNGIRVSGQNSRTLERQKGKAVKGQSGKTVKDYEAVSEEDGEEKATIELSLYLRPSQDDKLEDLKRDYRKITRRKISSNEIMRRLIDQATLEQLMD